MWIYDGPECGEGFAVLSMRHNVERLQGSSMMKFFCGEKSEALLAFEGEVERCKTDSRDWLEVKLVQCNPSMNEGMFEGKIIRKWDKDGDKIHYITNELSEKKIAETWQKIENALNNMTEK